ncbi:MAG: fasciclin domain-containing protein [bacterium]
MKRFLLVFVFLVAVLFFSGCAIFQPEPELDIVDTAIQNGNFTTLVGALTEADLVTTLRGSGPFTVFAPTDDAFDKIDPAVLSDLVADVPKLTKVLTFHVVSGEYLAADVVGMTSLTSLEGSDLNINVTGSTVQIDGAVITITDIECSNGVIHVIDSVMIPPTVTL